MKKFRLKNLDCQNCAAQLQERLARLDCVKSVSIDFSSLTLLLDTDDLARVRAVVSELEPDVILLDPDEEIPDDEEAFIPRKEIIRLIFTSVLFGCALLFQKTLETTTYHLGEFAVFLFIYLFSGWQVLATAIRNIVKGRVFDESFLMTVSTIGAIAVHALAEAAGVMLFYQIGEFLQNVAVNRSRRSIKSLLEIRPGQANLLEDGVVRKVSPETVRVGDRVVVNPGEKVPLDGTVLSGRTQVDASALTGESVPRSVREGDTVLAGMINKLGMVTLVVTRPFGESSISRILELVENATHKKAKAELFFTTFARYYTPVIVVLSLLTAVLPPLLNETQTFSTWIYRALVILVISCPCALVVSIPLTYFGGIGAAAKRGVLIKGSNYLDALNVIDTLFLDKTGTLTKGVFKVTEIVTRNGFSSEQLLEWAAKAETHSNHPIAVSIRESYGSKGEQSASEDYEEIEGGGIRAVVEGRVILAGNDRILHRFNIEHDVCSVPGTVVHVAMNGQYAGYLIISDEIKTDSAQAIRELKALGIGRMVMLTGDGEEAARAIGQSIGLDEWHANLLPEDKVALVERHLALPGRRGLVAFVGDGINDAPVLARADIGISMGDLGSDAAIETADVVIMNDSLMKIPEAIRVARKNRAILVENIVFALGVKLGFVILGFLGVATMWEAVFGDMGVALIAILNASRMLRTRP